MILWTGESYNRTRGHALDDFNWKMNCWRSLKSSGHRFWKTRRLLFTSRRDTALHNIGWHKKNDPNAGFFIVQVQVPHEMISNLKDSEEKKRKIQPFCTGGYLQDTLLYTPRDGVKLNYEHLVALTRKSGPDGGGTGDGHDDRAATGTTRRSCQTSRVPYRSCYSILGPTLDQHVVAHIDSKDLMEIERMRDSNDKAPA